MKKISLLIAISIILITDSQAQVITSAKSGNWNGDTTWVGGVVPTVANSVIIASGHSVTKTSFGDTCGTLVLQPNSTLTLLIGGMPSVSWSSGLSSTVIYNGPTTVQTASAYGNLVYSSANGAPNGDLYVDGNLTITANTLRGAIITGVSRTHNVAGDVILTSSSSRISAVNLSSATNSSCVWNIGGSVKLTSANSGTRLILYESAGPHTGSAVYNIGGNLELSGDGTSGGSSQVQFKSSSSTTANYPEGVINLYGNLVQNGPIGINSANDATSTPGFKINFVGSSVQNWSGLGSFSVSPMNFKIHVNINNAAGVTLSSPRTFNNNTVLNLVNGKLTTDATNLLTLSGTGAVSSGSSSSFINGPMAFANSTAGVFSKAYPIGKGSNYSPIILSLNQTVATSSSFKAEMFNGVPSSNTLPGSLDKVSLVRYYTLIEGGSEPSAFTNGIITLNYGSDDGVTDAPNLRVAQGPIGGGGSWVDIGGTGTSNGIGSITSTVNFTSLSNFVLANATGGGNSLQSSKNLSLTGLIEGFYNGSAMIPDSVNVELRNTASPFTLVESSKTLLNTSGQGNVTFYSAQDAINYYLVVKHRNALETWSASGQQFTGGLLTYDFTTSQSQAYGNNMVQKAIKWCFYSGDVNHDGVIDISDVGSVDIDNLNFMTGYTDTDINGDNLVDLSDLSIVDTNNLNFISKITP